MSNSTLQVYGGDDVFAIVIDPGSFTTNIGFSGTDTPQSVLPSCYGFHEEDTEDKNKVFSEQSISIPRPNYEIKQIVENGIVVDWDAASEQWSWAIKEQLFMDSTKDIPVLLTEPIWNDTENRKKALEVLFEGLDFNACYLAATPTCLSYASGKPTSLVVDIGHDTCSVNSVVDGITLFKSSRRNCIAGKYINHLINDFLKPRDIIPLFAIEKRRPEFVEKTFDFRIDPSLYTYANDYGFFQECKETLCQVSPTLSLKKMKLELESMSKRSIESPWAEEIIFDNETRYGFGEQLFHPVKDDLPEGWNDIIESWSQDKSPEPEENKKVSKELSTGDDNEKQAEVTENVKENGKRTRDENTKDELPGIVDLVTSSITANDVDLRATLAHNIVLTGGTSSIPGLGDRLALELNKRLPALKFRILTSGYLRERQYQAWLGGSILTSLGTFQQLWVSKDDYNENGPDRILEQRFT